MFGRIAATTSDAAPSRLPWSEMTTEAESRSRTGVLLAALILIAAVSRVCYSGTLVDDALIGIKQPRSVSSNSCRVCLAIGDVF